MLGRLNYISKSIINSCIGWIVRFHFNIKNAFRFVIYKFFIPPTNQPKLLDATETYISTKTKLFQAYIEASHPDKNQNIDPAFYDRTKYKEVVEVPNNFLEQDWQSKLLITSTPRGNIAMFYDAYKEAFAYYSDTTGIPYKILNLVAAQYVMKFKCLDFFIDETIFTDNKSPFIIMMKEEDKKEQEKKKLRLPNTMVDQAQKPSLLPFAKLKNYKDFLLQDDNKKAKPNSNMDKVTNKILYKGKFHNFNPLKQVKIPAKKQKLKTSFDDQFQRQSEAQSNLLQYKLYKNLIQGRGGVTT
jgi:hypothetical protein